MSKKAVILFSGGVDSTTVLALVKSQNYECYTLSFNYGQRHISELKAAADIAQKYEVKDHKIIHIGIDALGGSALTDKNIPVPDYIADNPQIPITYVPARNTIFLSIALGFAETVGAWDIFYGANALDYSGYPDCRSEYLQAFEQMATLATKASVTENKKFKIHTPLINLKKSEIIQWGHSLQVDYSQTISCYSANEQGQACGRCDSCTFRINGFKEANLNDPTPYQSLPSE